MIAQKVVGQGREKEAVLAGKQYDNGCNHFIS